MKRLLVALMFLALIPYVSVHADDEKDRGGGRGGSGGGQRQSSPHAQRAPKARHRNAAPSNRVQSRGGQQSSQRHSNANHATGHAPQSRGGSGVSGAARSPHAISPALRSLGVTQAPHRFTSRAQILNTDRAHSAIPMPQQGFGGHAIAGHAISGQNFNDPVVRNHMNFIMGGNNGFGHDAIGLQIHGEAGIGQYYWHHNNGFDYVHYNDHWGYNWYGWYLGQSYFWTRYYGNQWWFYDNGYNRWCYWSNGYWWWQDPDNLSNEYIYQNNEYVPADMGPAPMHGRRYLSSDGTCLVKIQGENNDAYLLDTRKPPVYEPLLLASGVTNLKFYEPRDASPIQIMLTMSDGSVKVFDDQGNPQSFDEPPAQEDSDAMEGVDSHGSDASSPPQGGGSPSQGGDSSYQDGGSSPQGGGSPPQGGGSSPDQGSDGNVVPGNQPNN